MGAHAMFAQLNETAQNFKFGVKPNTAILHEPPTVSAKVKIEPRRILFSASILFTLRRNESLEYHKITWNAGRAPLNLRALAKIVFAGWHLQNGCVESQPFNIGETMNFIPDSSVLLAYSIGVLVLTFTPGPDMTFFLGRTLAQGVSGGIAAMSGASAGLLVHSTLVAFGLSALIIASPTLFFALKVVGAAYLLWLAVDAIRNGSALNIKGKPSHKPLGQVFLQGLGINLLNPKIIIFFMTFLPQFVDAKDPDATGKLLFLGVMFVIVALPFTIAMILAADQLTAWLKQNPRITRIIDWVFASVFGAFAVKILLTERG